MVDPSPYDLIPAGLTKALHNGQVLSRSNLKDGGSVKYQLEDKHLKFFPRQSKVLQMT